MEYNSNQAKFLPHHSPVFPQNVIFAQREKIASKICCPPKEMLLSFSIVPFLTNYDVTNRILQS